MNDALFIASIIFIYISYGCAWNYAHKELGPYEATPELGKLMYNLIISSAFILPVISLCHVCVLKWYWLFLINLIVIHPLSSLISFAYSSIFGCKTSFQYNYDQQKMMKSHLYGADMLITMVIGVALFILAFVV